MLWLILTIVVLGIIEVVVLGHDAKKSVEATAADKYYKSKEHTVVGPIHKALQEARRRLVRTRREERHEWRAYWKAEEGAETTDIGETVEERRDKIRRQNRDIPEEIIQEQAEWEVKHGYVRSDPDPAD